MSVVEFVHLIDRLKLRFQSRTVLKDHYWSLHCADGEALYIFDGKNYTLAQRRTLSELFSLANNVTSGHVEGRTLTDNDPYADRRTSRPIKVLI
jgi:hypothetical protein